MKFPVITLALLTFVGSQAYVLRDEPYPHLARLNQELQEYLRNVTRVVDEKIEVIRRSELGQSVIDKLHNSFTKISKRLRNLKEKLPAEVVQGYDLVVGASLGVVDKSLNTIRALHRKVSPASDELAEALYTIVAPYADSVLEKVVPYAKSLQHSLVARAEELNPKLNEKLKKQLEELKAQLAPYTDVLQKELEEFRSSLDPYVDQAQEKLEEGVEKVSQILQPYFSRIFKALQERAEEFKEWVKAPAFSPSQ
ncbi:apolipoprotein A-I-like [Zootoca vivipara]|uniref:apolipoprotein A-I-like n=1 Tax=Zootoca vivipara TaxID=8524 RepID=UPI001591013C|nr:apolipoprotein A-I-like [Zootoca vivipara]